jgi:isochorismate synthase EntC
MSAWAVNGPTPAVCGPHGWDLAGLEAHIQVALAMPQRSGLVSLRARLQADRPLVQWLQTGQPALFWRPPGRQARVGVGELARCPVTALRLLPDGSDWQVSGEDLAAVQRWQASHVASCWFAVHLGWPTQAPDGQLVIPLSLWLPEFWLAELPPTGSQTEAWDIWWQARRNAPEQVRDRLKALLQPPAPETNAVAVPGQGVATGSVDIESLLEALRDNSGLAKVVAAWPDSWETHTAPWQWLAAAAEARPGDYAIGLQLPDTTLAPSQQQMVVCASPERLGRVDDHLVESLALAGTLSAGQEVDSRLQAEHGLVRDFVVAAMHKLGLQPGAPELAIRQAGPLQHLATRLVAERPPGLDALRVALALHPTPALLGWPRPQALRHIQAAETTPRDWYGGCAGVLSADGSGRGELAVLLRGAAGHRQNGRWRATAWAGAGLVAASQSEQELAEITNKHRAIAQSMGWHE